MLLFLGTIGVLVCVLGGYAGMGGNLHVLWQPYEVVIIVGAAIGAYIIANPKSILIKTGPALKKVFKGSKYQKEDFNELLSLMYTIFKISRSKGAFILEPHVEDPDESTIFQDYENFLQNSQARVFLLDYLRLIILGANNPHLIEDLMNEEIEVIHQEGAKVVGAMKNMADALPALGIVAAVLGIIKTMGSITEPPEVLGVLIGGALVGTFLGVFLSYGFVGPVAQSYKNIIEQEHKYIDCIKSGILAYLNGFSPVICVEFARKSLSNDMRPSFYEIEESVSKLKT